MTSGCFTISHTHMHIHKIKKNHNIPRAPVSHKARDQESGTGALIAHRFLPPFARGNASPYVARPAARTSI